MGVQGLWTILEPAARPVKLETLAKKRLAVDASIWIYQFLKAVRDKEGQALRNSHIVGFFRRICKLLFFGIKPVFVFDGGAPALKRQTLAARAARREGRKEDATRTAGKMLALQMTRRAQMENEREKLGIADPEEDQIGEDVVYFGEIDLKPEERKRKFRKTDQYHLPNLEFPLERMAAPTDTRILTQDELEQYAKDYHLLEDLSHYDFSSLDFDSDYFRSLPPAEQYSILNAARLRSRLRMGYSKEQLDEMFPDRLAFSRFQIQRLKERNDYTQRLMNLNGMNDVGPQRIAGEKGREYFLVRNEGVEGGWVLGTTKNEVGGKEKPVLVDVEAESEEDDDVDGEFEDVPLETSHEEPPLLAKIPQLSRRAQPTGYGKQTKLPFTMTKKPQEGLFIVDDEASDVEEAAIEGIDVQYDDDADLQAAINLSMEPTETPFIDLSRSDTEDQQMEGSIISEDRDLDQAIALSLSHEQPRPTTSSSNNSDLQRALELSRNEHNIFQSLNAQSFDDSDIDAAEHLYSRFPLSATDKGKGRALSLTPERPVSADDEELQRTIELSKSDFRGNTGVDGVGPSGVMNMPVEESPSKGGVLGRSMFRKKQNNLPKVANDGISKQVPTKNQELLEIVKEHAHDVVLEEKIQQASPVAVPTSTTVVTPPSSSLAAPEIPTETIPSAPASLPAEFTASDSEIPPEDGDILPIPNASDYPSSHKPSQSQEFQSSDPPQSSHNYEDQYFSDEDEDLIAQLAAEAEEHARFTSSINPHASRRPEDYSYSALHDSLTEEDFEREMRTLRNQQKKDRRDADEVNQLMVTECQQLLRLFGLPYITAPMEAEAQCAELVRLGLVDGIVTDDSDIFLFGGTRVYKNMFNQGKFVECYLQSDLERDFNLNRRKFINLAHLLGSDYAEGLPHVGPVNALELLSDFHGDNGLEEFRNWWIAVQQGRAPKDAGESEFRRKFRRNSTKIFLPNDFPNRVIDQAYLKPEVDHDPQAFVWGVPDLDALRSFLMAQIGWSKERTDEILVPVIKDMNRRQIEGNQTNLTDFFEGSVGSGTFAPRRKVTHRSKRLTKAMASLRREPSSEDDVQEISPRRMAAKRRRAPSEAIKIESDDDPEEEMKDVIEVEESSSSDDDNLVRMRGESVVPAKRGKKTGLKAKPSKKSRGKRLKE